MMMVRRRIEWIMPEKAEPQTEDDRRGSQRSRALVGGTIVFRDGSHTLPCVVRNRSDLGIQIEVPGDQLTPNRFYLLTTKDNVAFEVEVAWRKGGRTGLTILHAADLATTEDPAFHFLKRMRFGAAGSPPAKPPGEDEERWPV